MASGDECPCADYCGMPLCSPPGRFWLRADYLMWWTSGMTLPPLVTTGTTTSPTSTVLFGNDIVNDGGRSGFRTTCGDVARLPPRLGRRVRLPGPLGVQSAGFSEFSAGNPILTRPFFNVQTNQADAEMVAFPATGDQPQVSGSISVVAKDYFQSAGVSMSYNLCSCGSCCDSCDSCMLPVRIVACRCSIAAAPTWWSVLRYYNLSDSVLIHETPQSTLPLLAMFDINDNFSARTTSSTAANWAYEPSCIAAAGHWKS